MYLQITKIHAKTCRSDMLLLTRFLVVASNNGDFSVSLHNGSLNIQVSSAQSYFLASNFHFVMWTVLSLQVVTVFNL
jgi:hypothetical protein